MKKGRILAFVLFVSMALFQSNVCLAEVLSENSENIQWLDIKGDYFELRNRYFEEDAFTIVVTTKGLGGCGIIDSRGNILVQPKYDMIMELSEGLAAVAAPGSWFNAPSGMMGFVWGYVDKSGNQIGKFKYHEARKFHEGMAAVAIGEGKAWNYKWGFIDNKGNEITELKYDEVRDFHEGMAAVKLGEKWGFINKEGKEVVPVQYNYVWDYNEGLAAVDSGNKHGCMDKEGELVLDLKYDGLSGFSEGLAHAVLGDKVGYIDKNDNIVIPFDFERASTSDFHQGFASVSKNGKYALINKKGKVVTDFIYDHILEVYNDVIIYYKDGHYGWMDKNCNKIMPAIYTRILPLNEEGLIAVELNGKYALFTTDGKRLTPFKYRGISDFDNGVATVSIYDAQKYTYIRKLINKFGKEIYDNPMLISLKGGIALVGQRENFVGGRIKKLGVMELPARVYSDLGYSELIKVSINEKNLFLPDQDPVIDNQRVLVPMRAIFEALGATIQWDTKEKKVTGIKGDISVDIVIGNNEARVNGNVVQLDTSAKIIGERTMVPIRFIAESFGCEVTWEQDTRSVKITYDTQS